MSVFLYRAGQADGTTLEGRVEGENEQLVRQQLEGQGLYVFKVQARGHWRSFSGRGFSLRPRVSRQEFLVFNQEFLALVKAGLPILKAWDLLIERVRRPGFLSTLQIVRQDIRNGVSLSEALSRHPEQFPDLYVASIRAGEQSGNLLEVLHRYIAYLKLMLGLRQKMTKAMAYPAFLVLVGVSVVAFLLTYVLPTFASIYGDSTQSLPAATQTLIWIVTNIRAHLLLIIVALAGTVAAAKIWLKTTAGRDLWDRVILRLPVVGNLLIQHHTIQLTRTLATILAGGIPLLDALKIIAGGESNRYLAAGLDATTGQVQDGAKLAMALQRSKVLPRMAVEMIAVGEETGSLDVMLRDVAEFYENELDQRLSQLTTWIEPVLLLIMGVIVGGIVIVMYLPVFELAGTVR
jgi:type IV pilus assembly protein PilC